MTDLVIRPATRADVSLVLAFIRELAEYEELVHEVVATEDDVARELFDDGGVVEAVIAEVDGEPVGFALYFFNYSTFVGRRGLYLEDLYVRPEHRGGGHGKALLVHLARLAVERGCGRFEWTVLDWNEPAKAFYRAIGARPMDGWTIQRLDGDALRALAEGG